ncbi:MAG: UPF0149 family protein [Gammaproteobacteria bacterium]|nr:UPF0149 family protein [Gammaproteobacteria bacterium]MYF51844.1 UPF0149 family protein [Gammaproteobacteria bacterium]MYG11664.1 UPF0149 family protein [Gammaproteobacteria bacterium]MYK27718.1 UPF0149 family protein [Gammaproteobacteria bacterium]
MADLTALAVRASQSISISELHGAVCGLAAGSARSLDGDEEEPDLLQALIELLGSDALTDAESVDEFMRASLDALLADDLSFAPLLPDDDAPIAARVQGIAEWCGAFAAGYGAQPVAADEQSEELLRDFIAISGAETDDEDDEAAEAALSELEQYAKVGALLLTTGGAMADDAD